MAGRFMIEIVTPQHRPGKDYKSCRSVTGVTYRSSPLVLCGDRHFEQAGFRALLTVELALAESNFGKILPEADTLEFLTLVFLTSGFPMELEILALQCLQLAI